MKTTTIIALTVACLPNLATARCYGGSNQRPDSAYEVINFFYEAGCALQDDKVVKDKPFKHTGKSKDGKCMTVLVKNHGDTRTVTSDQAVESWVREWWACEHGGERKYDDNFEYIWHMDC